MPDFYTFFFRIEYPNLETPLFYTFLFKHCMVYYALLYVPIQNFITLENR